MKIIKCEVAEGNLYQVVGVDEMLVCFPTFLVATDTNGNKWQHFYVFAGHIEGDEGNVPFMEIAKEMAQKLADTVNQRGVVNPRYWTKMEEGETLEERWSPFGSEWQREQEERRGNR